MSRGKTQAEREESASNHGCVPSILSPASIITPLRVYTTIKSLGQVISTDPFLASPTKTTRLQEAIQSTVSKYPWKGRYACPGYPCAYNSFQDTMKDQWLGALAVDYTCMAAFVILLYDSIITTADEVSEINVLVFFKSHR